MLQSGEIYEDVALSVGEEVNFNDSRYVYALEQTLQGIISGKHYYTGWMVEDIIRVESIEDVKKADREYEEKIKTKASK